MTWNHKCESNIGHKMQIIRVFDGGADNMPAILMDTQTVSFSASYLQFAEYIRRAVNGFFCVYKNIEE